MARTIRASFANGVFTPLEPLTDIEEGSLFVLNIEMATPNLEPEGTKHRSAPDNDPKRLKNILAEMEVKDYLRNKTDSDFNRFPGVRWSNPLQQSGAEHNCR